MTGIKWLAGCVAICGACFSDPPPIDSGGGSANETGASSSADTTGAEVTSATASSGSTAAGSGTQKVRVTQLISPKTPALSSATMDGFPLLVRFNDMHEFDFDAAGPTSETIRFFDTTGAPLPFEIDFFDPEARLGAAWVRIPPLSPDEAIIVEYGAEPVGLPPPPDTAWDDAHVAVWHLTGVPPYASSTPGQRVARQLGGGTPRPGSVGGGYHAAPADGELEVDDVAGLNLQDMTLQIWVRLDVVDMSNRRAIFRDYDQMAPHPYSLDATREMWDLPTFHLHDAAAGSGLDHQYMQPLTPRRWHHIAGIYSVSAEEYLVCVDGDCQVAGPEAPAMISDQGEIGAMRLGWHLGGTIDEVRISSVARSQDWVRASFEVVENHDLMLDYSSPEYEPG